MRQSLLWSFGSCTLIFTADATAVNYKSGFSRRQSTSNILYQLPADGNAGEGIPAGGYTQLSAVFTPTAPNVLITIEQQDTSAPIFYDDFSVTSASNSTNALVNPGFETGSLDPWFVVNSNPLRNGIRVSSGADLPTPLLAAHTGNYALVDNADGVDGVEQLIVTTTGQAYTLTFWNLVDRPIPTGVIQVSFTNVFPPSSLGLTPETHTGPSISDGISDVPVPIITGYGTTSNVQVNVYLNGVYFDSNYTQNDNSFLLNLPDLVPGVYSITATELVGPSAETVESNPFILTYTSPVSASASGIVSSSSAAGSFTAPAPSSVVSASLSSSNSAGAIVSTSLIGHPSGLLLPGFSGGSSIRFPTGIKSAGLNHVNVTGSPATGSVTSHFTSTIYATTTYTITSCGGTVTNCPAKLGSVTTEIISSTTVCPCAATPTSYITSTYCDLTTYTITSCPSTVTNCPERIGSVTVETSTYTTVVPWTAPPASVVGLTTTINGTVTQSNFQTIVPVKSPTTSALSLYTGAAARQGVSGAIAVAAGFMAALL